MIRTMMGGFISPDKSELDRMSNISFLDGEQEKSDGNVTPIIISVIKECLKNTLDDVIMLDGKPLDHVVVVGRLKSLSNQSSRFVLEIDDGTGTLKIYALKKTSNEVPVVLKNFPGKNNDYLRIGIIIKTIKEQRICVCLSLKIINDYNEISYHLARALFAHLQKTKGTLVDGIVVESPVKDRKKDEASAEENPTKLYEEGQEEGTEIKNNIDTTNKNNATSSATMGIEPQLSIENEARKGLVRDIILSACDSTIINGFGANLKSVLSKCKEKSYKWADEKYISSVIEEMKDELLISEDEKHELCLLLF